MIKELKDPVTAKVRVIVGQGEADVLVPDGRHPAELVAEGEVYPGVELRGHLGRLQQVSVPGAEFLGIFGPVGQLQVREVRVDGGEY